MKNKYTYSEEDNMYLDTIRKTLDEVYEDTSNFKLIKDESNYQRKEIFNHKKSRISVINKHTIEQSKNRKQNVFNNNNDSLEDLYKTQPFNVLSLYQERDHNTNSRYLHHGDFTDADGHITKRIRRRKEPVQLTIDLHNMNQEEAHRALNNFILSSSSKELKIVRVITGKGKGGIGIIRSSIEKWINMHPIRQLIIGFDHAHKSDGGIGAINILLRSKKSIK